MINYIKDFFTLYYIQIMLQTNNYDDILAEFPKFELSYETMSHNKVHDSDVILAIPDGDKFFVWFTVYNDENVCFLLNLDTNGKPTGLKPILTSFDDKMVYGSGTIFYGTIFTYNGVSCFCIEDLYFYKGNSFVDNTYLNKLQTIKNCLQKDLCSTALTNKFTIFGLPIMNTRFNDLLQNISLLPYKISQIQFRYIHSKKVMYIKYYKPGSSYDALNGNQNSNRASSSSQKQMSKAIFKITPQIQNDIYNLFIYNDGKEEFYDIAFIPDYNTSVLMNKLFRNIKENQNLDALEESDDEEEFQDNREDKFVFLDRSFKMHCQYNYKFKKWTPLSLAAKNDRIVSANILQK